MGLFGKRKKNAATGSAVAVDELLAVIGAAVAASDSAEHIAVISAAIAAYEGDSVQSNLRIGKIDRTAGRIPAWGVAGNRESIDVRRM
jgi:hypothetical protein